MSLHLQTIIQLIAALMNDKFTGQLRLNLHEGNLSEKVEKKESFKIDEMGLLCGKIKAKEIREEILNSPPERKE